MASMSRSRHQHKRSPNQLAELGLFDIPNLDVADDSSGDTEVDESALEAELEALLSGKAPSKPTRPKPKVLDIEKLAAACMQEEDEDDEGHEGNLSADEDLLNELQSITETTHEENESAPERRHSSELNHSSSLVSAILERSTIYKEAIKVAKENGDSSKVRRYGRALKTLEDLLKSAKSGAAVNEEDIPPAVKVPKAVDDVCVGTDISNTPSTLESVTETVSSGNNLEESQISTFKAPPTKSELITRRYQYKVAAVRAKKKGNRDLALSCLKTVKTFDAVIEAIENNVHVDLSNVPLAPKEITQIAGKGSSQRVEHDNIQMSSDIAKAALAAAEEPEEPELFAAPPSPASVLEALLQRLEKYAATKQAAEAENNGGKVRRLQRIIKQYETAIRDHKAGKHVDYESLPVPPGFAPIPFPSDKPIGENGRNSPPFFTPKEQSKISGSNISPAEATTNTPAVKKPKIQRANTSTVVEKQFEYLLERKNLFRQAALAAKQNGDMQQAKEYLRMSKGFDSMIEAVKCGLPIDVSTIPTPPQLKTDFVIVDASQCSENENCNLSQEELLRNLERDLCHQIELCTRNKEHFLRLGDVSSASKFEKLGIESKKDLTVVHHLKNKDEPAPRFFFHYETRLFSIVQCHTDLGDNELEVTVERGINLPGKPHDLDSYVRLEFPIPQEAPQRAKTHTIRNSNNPVFEEEFKFLFNRKSRSQLRQFKRQALKLEVMSKGGFLRSDSLLGTINVKLLDLESKCSIHNSFNLVDGRKALGGKLEVKLRIRDPLLVKQVEEVREKWLVIGS